MNGKQLKNSILQWAIQGKLVPQDPNDGKAMIGNNQKTPKKTSSFDDYLFEIPENWKWCQLFQIADVIGGYAFKSEDLKSKNGVRVIRISDITPNGISNKSIVRCPIDNVPNQYAIRNNDILMAMTGGTVGKSMLLETMSEPMYLNQRVAIIRARDEIGIKYLDTITKSPLIQTIISDVKNSTNDNISMADILGFPIPLPPLTEQHRIVAKIEKLMPLVEKYGAAQEALDEWNQALPEKLKKSILQEAIQGKLVPQDPADEPATALLERIREEKKRLVKEGKLKKKDLEVKPIEEDEIPFEIPESWEWVRLISLCDYIHRGKSPKYGVDKTLPIIAQKCNQWDKIYTEKCLFAEKNSIESYLEEQYLQIGDTIINSTGGGTVGRTGYVDNYVFAEFTRFVVDSHVTVVRANRLVNKKYVYYYLISPFIQNGLEDRCSGSTNQIELGTETIKNYRIPLPPLAEQRRIVAKIEELFGVIKK